MSLFGEGITEEKVSPLSMSSNIRDTSQGTNGKHTPSANHAKAFRIIIISYALRFISALLYLKVPLIFISPPSFLRLRNPSLPTSSVRDSPILFLLVKRKDICFRNRGYNYRGMISLLWNDIEWSWKHRLPEHFGYLRI